MWAECVGLGLILAAGLGSYVFAERRAAAMRALLLNLDSRLRQLELVHSADVSPEIDDSPYQES